MESMEIAASAGLNRAGAITRISRIDAFRVAAILAVICLHTKPFLAADSRTPAETVLGTLIIHVSRFAVPFFLIISGYFFGSKLAQGDDPIRLAKKYTARILPAFFFWNVIYLVSPALTESALTYGVLRPIYWHAQSLIADPIRLVFQGTKGHLWFLVSLVLALWTLAIMVRFNLKKTNVFLFAGALYVLGLLNGAYSSTPLGINLHIASSHFILFSMICVVIGWELSHRDLDISTGAAMLLIVFGFAVQLVEAYTVWKVWEVPPTKYSYYAGTILFGTGVVLVLLGKKNVDQQTLLSRIGRYTFGIYGVHVVFAEMFAPLSHKIPGFSWQIISPFFVYLLSLATVVALSRTRLRPLIV